MEPRKEHPQGLIGMLATLRETKGGRANGGRGYRSGMQHGDAGVEGYLGRRRRVKIQ